MKKHEAEELVRAAENWFPEDSAGRLIMASFEVEEYNGEAFAAPMPFSRFTDQAEWTQSKDSGSVTAQIRRMQESMDANRFPLRTSVYLTHEKGFCLLILGTEQVDVTRARKEQGGLFNVTLSFEEPESDELPRFGKDDLVNISASSPVRGWLYLFAVDADRLITPVYPGEGERSDILLSQNSRCNITDKINAARKAESKFAEPPPLSFCGDSGGVERIVALVADTNDPLPVTIAHLRSRFPLSILFAHEQRHRGIGYSLTDSKNDFSSLPLDQIAIGTLDYYYEG